MSHQATHRFEKLQVQLATLAALAAVYLLAAPAMTPADPQSALAYLAYGRAGTLLDLALLVWGTAAVAAVATVKSRAHGPLVVALLAAGGLSLRSSQFRSLVWLEPDSMRGVFIGLIGEMAIMAGIVVVAAFIVDLVRSLLSKLHPALAWNDPLAAMTEEERKRAMRENVDDTYVLAGAAETSLIYSGLVRLIGVLRHGRPDRVSSKRGRMVMRSLYTAGTAILVALVLLMLLMKCPYGQHPDAQRGQVLFAIFVSCLVGTLVAHWTFPTPYSVVAWIIPLVLGTLAYLLGSVSSITTGMNSWMNIPIYSAALPIDWMTIGAGAAVLGFWFSSRMHEARLLEKYAEATQGQN